MVRIRSLRFGVPACFNHRYVSNSYLREKSTGGPPEFGTKMR